MQVESEQIEGGETEWIVGRHAVEEALRAMASRGGAHARRCVDRVLLAPEMGVARWWRSGLDDLARPLGVVVARAPRQALDRLASGAAHQGVAARVAAAGTVALEELLPALATPQLVVLVDGVEDPRNLGAVIRSSAAAGAGAVVVPERRSAGLTSGCAKAAAGALERVPVARTVSSSRAVELLKGAGIWVLGLDPQGTPLWDVDLTRPSCLVVGGEARGLSRLVRERCDVLVAIPMQSGSESLNASVAASVALFEVLRQRRGAAQSAAFEPGQG